MMNTTEQTWKPIPGHEGYEVSDHGQVRSLDRLEPYTWKGKTFTRPAKGRLLKQTVNPQNGYLYVHLGRQRISTVHRLVAAAFLGESEMMVLHKDGDRQNNRLDNLRYGTGDENYEDGIRHGTAAVGERHYNAIVTVETVREIRARVGAKEKVSVIARSLGLKYPTVLAIASGRTWRHV